MKTSPLPWLRTLLGKPNIYGGSFVFTQLVCIKVAGCLISLSRMKRLVSASLFKIIVYFFRTSAALDFFFCFRSTDFELHPSNIFRENRCWNDDHSFLNMIGAKLSDQRNSKHAGRFKSPYSAATSRDSLPRFQTKPSVLWSCVRSKCSWTSPFALMCQTNYFC